MRLHVAPVLALSLGLAAPAQAGDPKAPAAPDPLGRKIDEAVQRGTGGGFWGTILVARKGAVVLAKGYGFADYAERPNTPDTLFEIASVSKQVTAAAVLRLEQQGRLSTSDMLGKYFPAAPEDKRGITLQQLLTHTSGLSGEVGVPYASRATRDEFVEEVLAPLLASEPGSAFAYANAGYALLAAVVEVAAGTTFEEYVKKEVFAPAGLLSTGFIGDERLVKSDRVSSRLGDGPSEWTAANWHWGWGYRGMGGVVTTVMDLLKWDRALRGDRVLGEAARTKLYAPALSGYACGWMVEKTDRGTTRVFHTGRVMGYAALVSRWLEEDVLVVVLSNGKSDLQAVENAVTKALFPAAAVEADIDATAYELNSLRAVELKEGLAWDVDRDGERLRLRLNHGKITIGTIRLPRGYAAKLVDELDRAVAAYPSDAGGGVAVMEGGVYFAAYGGASKRLHLDTDLSVRVLESYHGRGEHGEAVEDLRPVLIVNDAPHHMWPLMVKMNVAAARALAAEVTNASK